MYNNSRYRRRTSIRGGSGNGFSGFPHRGRFNKPGFSSNNRRSNQRKSQLEGANINMFIRKATQDTFESEQTTAETFDNFNLNQVLKQNIVDKGYSKPTPIQS